MAGEYTSFYLKDLLKIINDCALNNQREPNMMMTANADANHYLLQNASISMYNRGIMKMREALIKILTAEEADPGG